MRKLKQFICQKCNKTFMAPKIIQRFCSRKCARDCQIMNRGHKPKIKEKRGYICVYLPEHPQAHRGYVYEHRIIIETRLKRILSTEEVVHHIDGDRSNNDIDNLQVMTQAEHVKLHVTKGGLNALSRIA